MYSASVAKSNFGSINPAWVSRGNRVGVGERHLWRGW